MGGLLDAQILELLDGAPTKTCLAQAAQMFATDACDGGELVEGPRSRQVPLHHVPDGEETLLTAPWFGEAET